MVVTLTSIMYALVFFSIKEVVTLIIVITLVFCDRKCRSKIEFGSSQTETSKSALPIRYQKNHTAHNMKHLLCK